MKTGRRHELQTNVLANYLGHQLQTVQPHLKWLGIAIVAVCVLVVAGVVISQRSAAKSATAWDDFLSAEGSTDRRKALEDVAAANEGTPAAIWALLVKGGMDLNNATSMIYQSRDEADKGLKDAIESFQGVIDQGSKYPFLVQRAHYGIGVAYETMGELKKAQKEYEIVVKDAETSAIGKEAKKRLAQLKDENVQKFYDWFVTQKDLPAMPQMNPNLPDDLRDLQDMPDMGLPAELFPGSKTPGGESSGSTSTPPGDIAPAGVLAPGGDTNPTDVVPAADTNPLNTAPPDTTPPTTTEPDTPPPASDTPSSPETGTPAPATGDPSPTPPASDAGSNPGEPQPGEPQPGESQPSDTAPPPATTSGDTTGETAPQP